MLYPAHSNQAWILFTWRPAKFKCTFAVAWLIPKENSSYCVLNFHLVWNTSRYERLYVCLFVFMVLFCSSFRSRSERPRALQLLIKMLIRLCLMWEGLVLLYRNFLFKVNTALCIVYCTCAILIWRSSARARYEALTPNRPEATCLIAEPVLCSGSRPLVGSSPPSPVLLFAPILKWRHRNVMFTWSRRITCAKDHRLFLLS